MRSDNNLAPADLWGCARGHSVPANYMYIIRDDDDDDESLVPISPETLKNHSGNPLVPMVGINPVINKDRIFTT